MNYEFLTIRLRGFGGQMATSSAHDVCIYASCGILTNSANYKSVIGRGVYLRQWPELVAGACGMGEIILLGGVRTNCTLAFELAIGRFYNNINHTTHHEACCN